MPTVQLRHSGLDPESINYVIPGSTRNLFALTCWFSTQQKWIPGQARDDGSRMDIHVYRPIALKTFRLHHYGAHLYCYWPCLTIF